MATGEGDILNIRASRWVAAAVALAAPAVVAAQTVGSGQGVADRPRPDYDPIGSRFGSFTVFPSVTVTGAATDNYLATDTDRRGDEYLFVEPVVLVRSDASRQQLEARAFVNQSVHANFSGDDKTQYGASTSDAFDFTRDTQFRVDASAGHYVESRTSLGTFQGAAEPVTYELYHAGLGVSHRFTDLTLTGNGALEYRHFNDTKFPNGGIIDQSYRNVRELTAGGSAQYDLRNGIGLIVSGQYDDEHYSFGPGSPGYDPLTFIDRDSSGYSVTGGVTLELTHLIFGQVQLGYINRSYRDPRLNGFGGLSYSADILWNVTPLTSLRFRASRSIDDTSSPQIAGYTRSDFHFFVDHELYRDLIVSADADYSPFRPNGIGVGGDEYGIGAGAKYLINRRYTVSAAARYMGRSSDSTFLRYHAVFGSVSFRVAF